MTVEAVREAHGRLMDQVARELVGEGYEVFVEPGFHLLPHELVGLRPDIVARRGDERLAVEVKLVPDPAAADRVGQISKAVQALPGWRFQLATGPRPEPSVPWSLADAEDRVGAAERLAAGGDGEAALVMLVAAAEAVGRRLAEIEQVRVQVWSPLTMFRELVHHGLIDRDDEAILERAHAARNLIIHGIAEEPLEPVGVADVVLAVRRLMGEAREAEGGTGAAAPPPHAA